MSNDSSKHSSGFRCASFRSLALGEMTGNRPHSAPAVASYDMTSIAKETQL